MVIRPSSSVNSTVMVLRRRHPTVVQSIAAIRLMSPPTTPTTATSSSSSKAPSPGVHIGGPRSVDDPPAEQQGVAQSSPGAGGVAAGVPPPARAIGMENPRPKQSCRSSDRLDPSEPPTSTNDSGDPSSERPASEHTPPSASDAARCAMPERAACGPTRVSVGVATVGPPRVSSSSAAGTRCELIGVGGVGGVALAGFAARFAVDVCLCWLKRRSRRV